MIERVEATVLGRHYRAYCPSPLVTDALYVLPRVPIALRLEVGGKTGSYEVVDWQEWREE